MSHDNVITVLGATGTQGGAVDRALLAGGEFTVRAVTRNAASPNAQASDDIGRVALRVFQRPAETIGATIPVVGEYLTGEQMTAALGAVLGEPVAYRPPGAFTARSVDDVVHAVATARRLGRQVRLTTTGHAMGRTGPLTDSLLLRPLLDAPVRGTSRVIGHLVDALRPST